MTQDAGPDPPHPDPPPIQSVVETALYFDDLAAGTAFYRDVLRLRVMSAGERLVAMDAGGGTVLLLFHRGATRGGVRWPGGWIPPHDGSGPLHLALGVAREDLDAWAGWLGRHGVEIESDVHWERGGRSLYFRDPAGHSVELVSPGTWENH
jgi:catechol 2,3-dioxygenase-like lactoylglutathione lyase family enzyme